MARVSDKETEGASAVRKFLFYRKKFEHRHLPSVIWNDAKKKADAEFGPDGTFTTTDPELAEKLISMGYPQGPMPPSLPPSGASVHSERPPLPRGVGGFSGPVKRSLPDMPMNSDVPIGDSDVKLQHR